MRHIILFFLGIICSMTVVFGQPKILIGGSGWDRIAILDKKSGRIEWSHPLNPDEECNSVAYTRKGEILYAYRNGAKLITKDHQVVWDYPVKNGELHTATVLPDGGYLLAICGHPAKIVELDKNGKVRHEVYFDTHIPGLHSQFRQVGKSGRGTYLVPLMAKGEVVELSAEGIELQRYRLSGNLFAVVELKNGNLLVSCGDAHAYEELDHDGQLVKRTGKEDINGVSLQFVAQIAPVKRGGIMICNWLGHSAAKGEPLLIELDAAGQVVWSMTASKEVKAVSAVWIIR